MAELRRAQPGRAIGTAAADDLAAGAGQRGPACGRCPVETWADYLRMPDDAVGPLCDGTRLGRWLNAEAERC